MGKTRWYAGNPERSGGAATLPSGNRRALMATAAGVAAALLLPGTAAAVKPIRIGTTAVFLDDQLQLLETWRQDLQSAFKQDVRFVQRRSYGEIVDLTLQGRIDAAWICGYPYVLHTDRLPLLVVPRYRGMPLYRSYLIVPAGDYKTTSIADLRGRVFAYSDPLSNSGYLVPRTQLLSAHEDPGRFFRKAFFTFAHSKVVEAVAAGLADGGAVDGYVWDSIAVQYPATTAKARVAWKSPEYGFPPLVMRPDLPPDIMYALRSALLRMHTRPNGRLVLDRLFLDSFIEGDDAQYDGIRALVRLVSDEAPKPGSI